MLPAAAAPVAQLAQVVAHDAAPPVGRTYGRRRGRIPEAAADGDVRPGRPPASSTGQAGTARNPDTAILPVNKLDWPKLSISDKTFAPTGIFQFAIGIRIVPSGHLVIFPIAEGVFWIKGDWIVTNAGGEIN